MRLFVGLGNPGPRHERQRHNVGFMAVDRIAADHGFSAWRPRFRGELAEGRLGRRKVMLLKPMTFMNLSGESVGEVLRFFRIEPAEMVVFHDELDLAPGRLRVKQGGGHAGHNGLRSLHQHVGEAFWRVRIGIGHPGHRDRVTGHVLGDFGEGERAWLDELLRGISEGAPALAEDDVTGFLAAVNRRMQPPRPARTPPPAPPAPEAAPRPAPDGQAGEGAAPAGPLARLLRHFGGGGKGD
ncbi:MAG: peptidyl-tRNA hydrolase [Paracoccaceae bacterium]|nr:MAG: peptidyl-tRNA hydrolase [Paracoccaceae bacterium]